MPEYIEREAALQRIYELMETFRNAKVIFATLDFVKHALENLPAADAGSHLPVRSVLDDSHRESAPPVLHGQWAKINNPGYSPFDGSPPYIFLCDQCIGVAQSDSQFCPNCGAKMKLEEDHE